VIVSFEIVCIFVFMHAVVDFLATSVAKFRTREPHIYIYRAELDNVLFHISNSKIESTKFHICIKHIYLHAFISGDINMSHDR
jgi:hypothetical protein